MATVVRQLPLYPRTTATIEHAPSGSDYGRSLRLDPKGILQLQRTIGNAAVDTMIQRNAAAATREGGQRRLTLTLPVQRDSLRGQPRRIRTEMEIEASAKPIAASMGQALEHWKNQAYWGVQNFVNEELEKRIDTMRSSGLTTKNFLQSLAGNLIWAAACFVPGSQAFTFIVSLTGIGIAAQASPPTASDPADKGVVSGFAEEVQGYLDKIEEDLRGKNDSGLLEQAKHLVLFNEELTEPELLELIMTSTFAKPMLTAGAGGKLIRFNDDAVKKSQKEALRTRLQHFMDVVPLVGTETEPETVAGHKIGGEYTLTLVAVSEGGKGDVRWGIGYEIRPRKTDLQGKVVTPGSVAIAKWVSDDVLNDVLRREQDLKIKRLIINALPTDVVMGPEQFAAHEKELRQRIIYGRAG